METIFSIIILVIVAAVAYYFYKKRPAPQGTYDNKDVRSGGSIGGGSRANDDKDVRSSGSIGGGTRGHDSPTLATGGSIGGDSNDRTKQRTAAEHEERAHETRRQPAEYDDRMRMDTPNGMPRPFGIEDEEEEPTLNAKGRHVAPPEPASSEAEDDDKEKSKPEFRSNGSFGGSRQ